MDQNQNITPDVTPEVTPEVTQETQPSFVESVVDAVTHVFTPDEEPDVPQADDVIETQDVSVPGMMPPIVEVIKKGDGATDTIYH